jgi:heat shock protein HtpX
MIAVRRKLPGDPGLVAHMVLTLFLLALVYLVFVAVLFKLGVSLLLIAPLVLVLLGLQYWFSDRLVLMAVGAREVSEQEAPQLHDIVSRLAQMAGIPKPRVAIIDSAVPNALATGRNPRHAVVAVTRGLMQRLEPPEVEAVLAHELSHVIHRDVGIMTMAAFFATLASFIVQMGMWGGLGGRGRRDQGNAAAFVLVVSAVVWVVSFFLIRALSRYREYSADRGSAILTGHPAALSSALLKISDVARRVPDRDLREVEGASALWIFPAFSRGSLSELFSTHPSLEHRIQRLERLEGGVG